MTWRDNTFLEMILNTAMAKQRRRRSFWPAPISAKWPVTSLCHIHATVSCFTLGTREFSWRKCANRVSSLMPWLWTVSRQRKSPVPMALDLRLLLQWLRKILSKNFQLVRGSKRQGKIRINQEIEKLRTFLYFIRIKIFKKAIKLFIVNYSSSPPYHIFCLAMSCPE